MKKKLNLLLQNIDISKNSIMRSSQKIFKHLSFSTTVADNVPKNINLILVSNKHGHRKKKSLRLVFQGVLILQDKRRKISFI